jgi:hypothetical protein
MDKQFLRGSPCSMQSLLACSVPRHRTQSGGTRLARGRHSVKRGGRRVVLIVLLSSVLLAREAPRGAQARALGAAQGVRALRLQLLALAAALQVPLVRRLQRLLRLGLVAPARRSPLTLQAMDRVPLCNALDAPACITPAS